MSLTLSVPPRADDERLTGLPVAVIGAGPVGLAAAAQLLERGIDVTVYEAGDSAGTAVTAWDHTRLFSLGIPGRRRRRTTTRQDRMAHTRREETAVWPGVGRRLPRPSGRDGRAVPTHPLRQHHHRRHSTGHGSHPLHRPRVDTVPAPHRSAAGIREELTRAVLDTSGTYGTPNALTSSGLAPTDPDALARNVSHALPDVLGSERHRFAGIHTVVVGAGHSAANTLLKLAALAEQVPGTTVTWAIRSPSPVRVYGSAGDELAARGQLGGAVHDLGRVSSRSSTGSRSTIFSVRRTGGSPSRDAGRGRRRRSKRT